MSSAKKFSAEQLYGARVYFDTNPIIYFLEGEPEYAQIVRPLFRQLAQNKFTAHTSALTLTEVLIKPLKLSASSIVQGYKDLLLDKELFNLIPMSNELFIRAAELGASQSLKTPDALHMACALQAQCQYFLTNDRGIKSNAGMKVVQLDQLQTS